MHDRSGHVHVRATVGAAVVCLVMAAGPASAQCVNRFQLGQLARSFADAVDCEHARLTRGDVGCDALAPPACAGSVVPDVLALAGTPGLTPSDEQRQVLDLGLRCQRTILRAIGRFAVDRVRNAARGIGGRRADARAARKLRRVPVSCLHFGAGAEPLPRAGAPCDVAAGGSALAECLRRALLARLEPVLRAWIKPSIVLILTDDQPASMLEPLETLRTDLIGDQGITFGRAAATTPVCAPSRASILTGQYARVHGVLDNYAPHAIFALDDRSTIATWLKDGGYRTGLFGKYINGYTGAAPHPDYAGRLPYVPPGWDEWHAFTAPGFFDYRLAENDVVREYGSAEADYSTDVLAAKAVDFVRSSDERPFFMIFSPYAPHDPATPAPRHAGRYSGMPPWRPPNYDEADTSDKAKWLRELVPPLTPELAALMDDLYPKMRESLLAVDEGIAAIMQALRETGRDEDTIVVYTSDNGFSLGEHRWYGKICPYEECLRVPLAIRYPRLIDSARAEARQVANIDLAPTLADFAGVVPRHPVDGVSLAPLLEGSTSTWRPDLMAEQYGTLIPTCYRSVRTPRYTYIEYTLVPPLLGQEAELYDLDADPHQLTSVHADPAYQEVRAELVERTRTIQPGWTQPRP